MAPPARWSRTTPSSAAPQSSDPSLEMHPEREVAQEDREIGAQERIGNAQPHPSRVSSSSSSQPEAPPPRSTSTTAAAVSDQRGSRSGHPGLVPLGGARSGSAARRAMVKWTTNQSTARVTTSSSRPRPSRARRSGGGGGLGDRRLPEAVGEEQRPPAPQRQREGQRGEGDRDSPRARTHGPGAHALGGEPFGDLRAIAVPASALVASKRITSTGWVFEARSSPILRETRSGLRRWYSPRSARRSGPRRAPHAELDLVGHSIRISGVAKVSGRSASRPGHARGPPLTISSRRAAAKSASSAGTSRRRRNVAAHLPGQRRIGLLHPGFDEGMPGLPHSGPGGKSALGSSSEHLTSKITGTPGRTAAPRPGRR